MTNERIQHPKTSPSVKFLHSLLLPALLLWLGVASACSDDTFRNNSSVIGEETWATLNFNTPASSDVNVATRATLDLVPESRVVNFFLYVFDGSGNRLYVHYFDSNDRVGDAADLQNIEKNCWWVSNLTTDDVQTDDPTRPKEISVKTHGTVRIFAPAVTGATLYMIANIDADMVNISPESLNTIRTEAELKNLTASLNQEITSRNGYFPMAGYVSINIADDGAITAAGGGSATVQLRRLDAKIKVRVRVATDNELSTTESGITTTQRLKEFVPESWRVVNVPKGSYVLPRVEPTEGIDAIDYANDDFDGAGYFDTETLTFEGKGSEAFTYTDAGGASHTVTSDVNSFSFYMLENYSEKKKSVGTDFHLRDRRNKNAATGAYDTTDGLWEYAPEDGTYLEIKGQVKMDVDVSDEAKTQQLCADVTYYIHLGDFATHLDDYNIRRNHYYTYTITIKGVNAIEAEVTSSEANDPTLVKEENSGATGSVYIAKESIFTFDAHYGQRVFCFDSKYIDPGTVTWYVKTPFGKEGVPEKIGDTEIPSGMDYKWVHFCINKIDDGTNTYSKNNRAYPGDSHTYPENKDGLMDVIQFTKYIKEQKRLLDAGQPNDFREEEDPDLRAAFPDNSSMWYRKRIYATVFIDEYYYDADPITGEKREGLWKEFVNQPNRMMHILCDSQRSMDDESTATGSVITLRQRSIQTPYNISKASLLTGWGCEQVDETKPYRLFFHPGDKFASNGDINQDNTDADYKADKGNDDKYNGLYNTCCLLNLISGSVYQTTVHWSTFLNYDRRNDYEVTGQTDEELNGILFLKEKYRCMIQSVLMRNRDNDGDDIIDPEEIRWYIASLDQLYGLFMGDQGLAQDAQLYPTSARNADGQISDANDPFNGSYQWRSHVLASTRYGANANPTRLWAEEGISTGNYTSSWNKQPILTVRCVRNLGMEAPTTTTILERDRIPEKLIQVTNVTGGTVDVNTVYRFDLSNINDKSLRFYTSRELEPTDETKEMARLYKGFETGGLSSEKYNYNDVKSLMDADNSPVTQEGYRIPNIREAALLYLYTDASWWNDQPILCCSYYSHSRDYGDGKEATEQNCWRFHPTLVNLTYGYNNGGDYTMRIRAVKDVK